MKSNKHMITTNSKFYNSKMRLLSLRDKVQLHLLQTLRAMQPKMLLAPVKAKLTKVRNKSSRNNRFEVRIKSPIELMCNKILDQTAKPVNQAKSREATTQRCPILEAIRLSTKRTQVNVVRIAGRWETQMKRWRRRILETHRVPNITIRTHISMTFNF